MKFLVNYYKKVGTLSKLSITLLAEKTEMDAFAKRRQWKVVEKLGGWGAVVRHLQSVGSARTTWIAQTRDLIKSVIRNENKKIEEKVSGVQLGFDDLKSLGLEYTPKKMIN